MKYNNFKMFVLFMPLLLLFFAKNSSSHTVYQTYYSNKDKNLPFKVLNMNKGDFCREGENYVCKYPDECVHLVETIKNNKYLDICMFEGVEPIVCCPPTLHTQSYKPTTKKPLYNKPNGQENQIPNTGTAKRNIIAEKCRQYKNLYYPKVDFAKPDVIGGTETVLQEFPHMAVLGYGDTPGDIFDWRCGGSLISDKWILTAAHCIKKNSLPIWVRLGDMNLVSDSDNARPKDYKIVEHVSHPGYKWPAQYNDIALLRLETEVEFSSFIRPVCLNWDPSLLPPVQIVTGWGAISNNEGSNGDLLKLNLDIMPISKCNISLFGTNSPTLRYGVEPDSMICAGSFRDNEDTCVGDSGGPLQVINNDNIDTYTQFGITSFGTPICGIRQPAVYTKVSTYVSWIERIVWPKG